MDLDADGEARFVTCAYSKDNVRQLPLGKSKKVVGLRKDKLGGKIMTEFVALRPKLYAYKSPMQKGLIEKRREKKNASR